VVEDPERILASAAPLDAAIARTSAVNATNLTP
jgi:hypothetical protein